jgi:hypothetical protein
VQLQDGVLLGLFHLGVYNVVCVRLNSWVTGDGAATGVTVDAMSSGYGNTSVGCNVVVLGVSVHSSSPTWHGSRPTARRVSALVGQSVVEVVSFRGLQSCLCLLLFMGNG